MPQSVAELRLGTYNHTAQPYTADRLTQTQCTHLWSQIIWCTTERPYCRLAPLREAEVRDFDVAVEVEKDVFGLEVAVDDVEGVQVVQGECDLRGVELRDRVWEALLGRQSGCDGEGQELRMTLRIQ